MKDRTWQERIAEAGTEPEIVTIVRDYLATLTHDEYAGLPMHLRPPKIVDATDIAAYALDLARHECEDHDELALVQRLAQVMSRASIRLSQILVAREHAA